MTLPEMFLDSKKRGEFFQKSHLGKNQGSASVRRSDLRARQESLKPPILGWKLQDCVPYINLEWLACVWHWGCQLLAVFGTMSMGFLASSFFFPWHPKRWWFCFRDTVVICSPWKMCIRSNYCTLSNLLSFQWYRFYYWQDFAYPWNLFDCLHMLNIYSWDSGDVYL